MSGMLLEELVKRRPLRNNALKDTVFSPSFYQPECISQYKKLNHHEELDKNCDKGNVIKYAFHFVKEGLPLKAIEILERYKRDYWPDVYRYILNGSAATFIS